MTCQISPCIRLVRSARVYDLSDQPVYMTCQINLCTWLVRSARVYDARIYNSESILPRSIILNHNQFIIFKKFFISIIKYSTKVVRCHSLDIYLISEVLLDVLHWHWRCSGTDYGIGSQNVSQVVIAWAHKIHLLILSNEQTLQKYYSDFWLTKFSVFGKTKLWNLRCQTSSQLQKTQEVEIVNREMGSASHVLFLNTIQYGYI